LFKHLHVSLRTTARRAVGAVTPWLLVATLSACGGAKSIEPFKANRVVAFGDEISAVGDDGRRSTVNVVATTGQIDCAQNPIWFQALTLSLQLPVTNCPATATVAPSVSRAVTGATVADLAAQIDGFVATSPLQDKDLVSMAVGLHDIVNEYGTVARDGEAAAIARLQAKGKQLGQQINRVAQSGPPVLAFTVYDIGATPFGRAEELAQPGRAAMLRRMTSAFNIAMRLEIVNDGRLIGLVDTFDLIDAVVRTPALLGVTNITDAACSTPTPACDTTTIARNSAGEAVAWLGYLWADTLRLGPAVHARVGLLAEQRARNNPF
jgi:outer membrane lipase/esterase